MTNKPTAMKAAEVAKLERHIGQALRLREDGYSIVEIAKKMNQSESTVRSWMAMIDEVKGMNLKTE